MTAETDLLARIDALTACASCGGPMTGSVSADFCGEPCQWQWHGDQRRSARTGADVSARAAALTARAWVRPPAALFIREGAPEPVGGVPALRLTDGALTGAAAYRTDCLPNLLINGTEFLVDAAGLHHRPGWRWVGRVEFVVGATPPSAAPPRDDVAQRALDARRARNTGPTVHADPRRNRR